jgi:hypothetical protein
VGALVRQCRVYRLEITYPEGSDAPGWVPACWPELLASIKDRARRRELRRRGFRWPRERLFLSASGAYKRAGLLTVFGATVFVDASWPVTWSEWQDTSANDGDWEGGSTAAHWELPEDDEERQESLAPSAADVHREHAEFWAGCFEGGGQK